MVTLKLASLNQNNGGNRNRHQGTPKNKNPRVPQNSVNNSPSKFCVQRHQLQVPSGQDRNPMSEITVVVGAIACANVKLQETLIGGGSMGQSTLHRFQPKLQAEIGSKSGITKQSD